MVIYGSLSDSALQRDGKLNMIYTRIIFWQINPSPHQSSWITELARQIPAAEIICVFQKGLSKERLALGWKLPEYENVTVYLAPKQDQLDQILNHHSERTIHVFSSVVSDKKIHEIFLRALATSAGVGLLSEGRDWRGWRGFLRQIHSVFHERTYRKKVDFTLAIGEVGIRWFIKCEYKQSKVYPFCYVVEKPDKYVYEIATEKVVRITAIGQLIYRKRFDILIRALSKISVYKWNLKIIGDGELRFDLQSLVENLGLQEQVNFAGVLDNLMVRSELSHADILVLPSSWDGWGAVVNEALMSGVPVICSDFCGASDLIRPGFNGGVFKSESLDSLLCVINEWVGKGPLSQSEREKIINWSSCIEGEAVAKYFVEILEHVSTKVESHPVAPWRICEL